MSTTSISEPQKRRILSLYEAGRNDEFHGVFRPPWRRPKGNLHKFENKAYEAGHDNLVTFSDIIGFRWHWLG